MSFKFYKFCQNGIITFLTATFSMFYSLSISGNMPWWAGLLIGIAATIVGFIPPIGMIYPFTFGVFILVALIKSLVDASAFLWLFLATFILHVIRNAAMLIFCKNHPQKSLEYDMAIRYGYECK